MATVVTPPYNTGSTSSTGGTGYPGDAATGHGQRQFISFIEALEPRDTPFLSSLGRGVTIHQPKFEWGVRSKLPNSGTLDATMTNSQTSIVVQAGEGSYLQAGDIIYIAADASNAFEIVWVSDDASTITSTGVSAGLVRAQGGTAADEHLDDAAWYVIGNALPENHDFTLAPYRFGDLYFNHPQRFQSKVQVDLRQDVTPNWEDPNAGIFESRLMAASRDVKVDLELALLFGQRQAEVYDGAGERPSLLTGLNHTIELAGNTHDQLDALLSPYGIQDAMKARWDVVRENQGDTFLTSMNTKMLWDTTLNIKRRADMGTMNADLTVGTIETSLGPVKLKVSPWMNGIGEGMILAYRQKDVKLHNYQGLDWHFRRKVAGVDTDGDHIAGSVSGDFSFSCAAPESTFKVYNFNEDIDFYPSDLAS